MPTDDPHRSAGETEDTDALHRSAGETEDTDALHRSTGETEDTDDLHRSGGETEGGPDPYRTAELTPDELDAELARRWDELLPALPELGRSLVRRYAEPHRRYHDRAHLLQVLLSIDALAGDEDLTPLAARAGGRSASAAPDLYLVRLAAWFHDAVYDLPERELTNEEASARLSVRELVRAGFEQEDLTQVSRLVRLTATHAVGARDPEGELLCDADLAILAAPPERYEAYVAAVREEYAAVPDEQFWSARLAVLEPLANSEIFRSGRAQGLKPAARANLRRELWSLRDRLGLEQPDDAAVEDSRP
jgi:predicted metal-dependent HD superfamily phosphohydrolase